MRTWFLTVFLAVALFLPSAARAESYQIDPAHSSVAFKIKHLFTMVNGKFDAFSGSIDYTPGQPDQWNVSATIQADSIDTNKAERDKHLRSADFFDVANFPTIRFQLDKVTGVSGDKAKLHGTLTMRGIEKPVTLDLQILGVGPDPWGGTRAGFSATTTLNRKDFGMVWNKTLDNGQFLIGDEVQITIDIEAKQVST